MFNFLKRSQPVEADAGADTVARYSELAALAELSPRHGPIGAAQAVAAFAGLASAAPGSITFLAAPESAGHRDAVRVGLAGAASEGRPCRSTVIIYDAASDALKALRLETADAAALVDGVTGAIEMLALTLPAAFSSDSYNVARMALDEELRSGHDEPIDALKRRASSANIGLLQTPLGYALAPMHDGRVVAPEVVKALPDTLKAEVESKLASFEAELSRALDNRSSLQQAYASARRDLDREIAGLAVRAALSLLEARFSENRDAKTYLETLRADLVRNAALFLPDEAGPAKARPRAPAELAADSRLARFKLSLACHGAPSNARLVHVRALDSASLIGEIHKPAGQPATPANVRGGGLSHAGAGIAVIALDDLLADTQAWPLLRRTLRAGAAVPMIHDGTHTRLSGLELPVDCRIVITGTAAEYAAWCARDATIKDVVPLVVAYEDAIPRTPESEREFAEAAAAIAASLKRSPLDAATLADLIAARSQLRGKQPCLSTDLDAVRTFILGRAQQPKAPHDKPAELDGETAPSPGVSDPRPTAQSPIKAAA